LMPKKPVKKKEPKIKATLKTLPKTEQLKMTKTMKTIPVKKK